MNEQTFQNIWTECLGFNIEQKPEEYKQLLSLLDDRKNHETIRHNHII